MWKQLLLVIGFASLTGCSTTTTPTTHQDISPTSTEELFTPTSISTVANLPSTTSTTTATVTPPKNDISMQLLMQLGGQINSIALQENIAFVGQGPRLVALDLSNIGDVQAIGSSDVLSGLVDSVIIEEEVAYVMAGKDLIRLNIADLTNIHIESQVELQGTGRIIIQETTAYVVGTVSQSDAQQGSFIATIDISTTPQLHDVINVPYIISSFALKDEILYLSRQDNGQVLMADVSNVDEIAEPSRILSSPQAYSLRIYGDSLILGSINGIHAFDISNPRRPTLQWKEEGNQFGLINDFAVFQNHLFTLGLQPAGTYISSNAVIDLPDESLGSADYLYSSEAEVMSGNYFLAVEAGFLSVYSIEGTTLNFLTRYTPPLGGDIVADEDRVLVGEYAHITSYEFMDFANQTDIPVEVEISTLTLTENYLFVTGEERFLIFDATNMNLLSEMRSIENARILPQQNWRRVSIPIINNVVYLYGSLSEAQEGIILFNISNPTSPQQVETISFDTGWRIADIAATEQWLAVSLYNIQSADSGWLGVYDLSSDKPQLVSETELSRAAYEIQVTQNLLLAGTDRELQVFSIPELSLLGDTPMLDVHEIGLSDSFAYVSLNQANQIYVVDLSNSESPSVVGAFDVAGGSGNLAISGDYVVVSNEQIGLYIFEQIYP